MVTAAMFRAIAERQTLSLFQSLLRHIDNPLVLRLAGRRLSSNRLLNAMLRDTISLTMLHGGLPRQCHPRAGRGDDRLPSTAGDRGRGVRGLGAAAHRR
jgi:hypothetical protein